jgi:hypothetical protein
MTIKKLDIAASVAQPAIDQSPHVVDKEAAKKKLRAFMDEELKTVRGIFQCFETPGSSTKIVVRKYPGHMFDQVMKDGEEYEVPLYVARHLNGIDVTATAINGKLGTCSYEVHAHLMDKNGLPIISREKRVKRYGFQSLQFAGAVA